MYYIKCIWQWLKNAISKILTFFRFVKPKASIASNIKKPNSNIAHERESEIDLSRMKQNININKSDSTCKQEGSTALNKAENCVQNVIDGIDP